LLRQPKIGHVSVTDGSVLINGKPVKADAVIRKGQRITTGANATAEIWAADRVLIKIKPQTDVTLTQTNAGYQLNLNQGGAISLVKTGTPYAVVTSVLKAEALGTGFFVQTEGPDRVYVCICTGHIAVSKGDFKKDLQATHHKAMIATQGPSGIETADGTLTGHDDDEIGALVSHFK
jgi:ferric-dicitrate binding protein FerR (iron transport regulator)